MHQNGFLQVLAVKVKAAAELAHEDFVAKEFDARGTQAQYECKDEIQGTEGGSDGPEEIVGISTYFYNDKHHGNGTTERLVRPGCPGIDGVNLSGSSGFSVGRERPLTLQ